MIAVAGSVVAPGSVRAWEAAERATAPRAGLGVGTPHALWFPALWHLTTVLTWVWSDAESETEDEEEGVGWAVSVVVHVVVCEAGLEAEAAPGAAGDLGDMLMGKEGEFESVLEEAATLVGA